MKYVNIRFTVMNSDGTLDRDYGWPKLFEQHRYFPAKEKEEICTALEELRKVAAMFAGRQSVALGDLKAGIVK